MTSTNTVSSIFPADTGYQVEKVSGATGTNSDRTLAGAAISTLRPNIESFRSALNERGLEGDDMTVDALYILDRTSEYLNGSPTSPAKKDLNIMVRILKPLVKDMQKAAGDIDRDDKSIDR